MSAENIFRDDFKEWYGKLTDKQQERFNVFADKHANFQLNDCINEIDDLKVIV